MAIFKAGWDSESYEIRLEYATIRGNALRLSEDRFGSEFKGLPGEAVDSQGLGDA